MRQMFVSVAAVAACCGIACAGSDRIAIGDAQKNDFRVVSDSEIYVGETRYHSWQELGESGYFHTEATRCALPKDVDVDPALRVPSDCSSTLTRVLGAYDPSVDKYRIPVVVHIIRQTNGTGDMPDSRVTSQIDILNEDFLALAGTNGANGNDAQIEFYLATEDPAGNPTNGITRTTNNTWFNDGGTYYNTLAWDPDRYLNIYTNSASGALGYVPFLPQTNPGGIGSNADRVVCLYSAFGRNAPAAPFNQGRTATHEVGHYLGLFHTFDGGCGTSSCYSTGDLICDTNRESSPVFGCPGNPVSCGSSDPKDNYMDYSDDLCMEQFTAEQNNRMRCTLLNYRTDLYEVVGSACYADCDGNGSLNVDDIDCWVAGFLASDVGIADCDGNGALNVDDVDCFVAAFVAGCP